LCAATGRVLCGGAGGLSMIESGHSGAHCSLGRPTEGEVRAASVVTASLFAALRNTALYPEDHVMVRKFLSEVQARLEEFLARHGPMRIDIDRERLLYRGEPVLEGSSQGDDLAFLLYRDGVKWIEFHRGVESAEIAALFRILNRHRAVRDEREGDVVTALWAAGLPHMRYEATDDLLMDAPLLDFSRLNEHVQGDEGTVRGTATGPPDPVAEPSVSAQAAAAGPRRADVWTLSPAEKRALAAMVRGEEDREDREDTLDVLLIILDEQDGPEDFGAILDFLREEFRDTLEQGEFPCGLNLLERLHSMRRQCRICRQWALPLIDGFLQEISGPDCIGILREAVPRFDRTDRVRLQSLASLLRRLSPEAVTTLGPMLLHAPPAFQDDLAAVIKALSARDIRPLEALLTRPENDLVQRMACILGRMDGDGPRRLLVRMLCHDSARVRRQALRSLENMGSLSASDIAPLLSDQDDVVRIQALNCLLRRGRKDEAEAALLCHLQGKCQFSLDRRHVLMCYRALGRCGSSRCVFFLQEVLMGRDWKSFLGRGPSVHREGAAVALSLLGTPQARQVLQTAARSFFPDVRRACRLAVRGGEDKEYPNGGTE